MKKKKSRKKKLETKECVATTKSFRLKCVRYSNGITSPDIETVEIDFILTHETCSRYFYISFLLPNMKITSERTKIDLKSDWNSFMPTYKNIYIYINGQIL